MNFLLLTIFVVLSGALAKSNEQKSQKTVIEGGSVTLHCPVRVKGKGFSIKSITWLKDGKMFYKFEPRLSEYAILFDVDNIEVEDDIFFNGTRITVGPGTWQTAGLYTCNAELFNPNFQGLKFAVRVDTEVFYSKYLFRSPSRY